MMNIIMWPQNNNIYYQRFSFVGQNVNYLYIKDEDFSMMQKYGEQNMFFVTTMNNVKIMFRER